MLKHIELCLAYLLSVQYDRVVRVCVLHGQLKAAHLV